MLTFRPEEKLTWWQQWMFPHLVCLHVSLSQTICPRQCCNVHTCRNVQSASIRGCILWALTVVHQKEDEVVFGGGCSHGPQRQRNSNGGGHRTLFFPLNKVLFHFFLDLRGFLSFFIICAELRRSTSRIYL